jgi:O-antigen/teichoic acid export membrane protein
VFPVVKALSFIFRSLGLSYQDATIALLGKRLEHFPELARFGMSLGLLASAGLALIAFTPLATVWFSTISGLSAELSSLAIVATRVLVPLPAISVLLSFQRAILIQGRRTRPITVATAIEVAAIAVLFVAGAWGLGLVGVTAAFAAFVGGRSASNLYLAPACVRVLRQSRTDHGSSEDKSGADPDSMDL